HAIAEHEQRFVFLPHRNVQKRIRADDKENAVAIAMIGVAEVAHCVHRIVELRAAEILARLRQRRHEMRMLGACQRDHSEAMRKWRKELLENVRWTACGNELDYIELEPAIDGARH